MALNLEKLREFRTRLATIDPERFNMRDFVSGDLPLPTLTDPHCGTTGCIAGWYCAFYAPSTVLFRIGQVAAEQLGLTDGQRMELFYERMRSDVTLDDALYAIDNLIEIGRVVWP